MSTSAVVPTLPLTSVSQADLQAQLVSILTSSFSDWTDTQASNNMIMLLEVLSAIHELDYAYINRMAREAFIQYALDYRNVTAHAKSLGYKPAYQTPSVVTALINSASAVSAATTIPAGTKFTSTVNGATWQTVADVLIAAGHTQSAPVLLWQWESFTDSYTGTGTPNQKIVLNHKPVVPSSVVVKVNGTPWNVVDNFVESLPTDIVYTWTMDLLGNYTIQFSDGVSGSLVPASASVSITYNVGGGSINSIGPNGIGTCLSDVTDAGNGTLLTLSAYNTLAAVPGADAETTSQVRARAPISAQSPRCLLTLSDVENAVNALPGVFTCIAANWSTMPLLPQYLMEVFVVPVGFGTPSPDLISSINTLLTVTKPLVMGQQAVVTGPTYVVVNFDLQVFIQPGYNQNAVQNAVAALITSMFQNVDPTKFGGFVIAFGMSIFMSVITALIQQIAGVRNVVILAPGDTSLSVDQFPVLGTITFASTV